MCSERAYHGSAVGDSAGDQAGQGSLTQQTDIDEDGERPELVPLPDDEFKDCLLYTSDAADE